MRPTFPTLRALFRPISLLTPDSVDIVAAVLYTLGFSHPHKLDPCLGRDKIS